MAVSPTFVFDAYGTIFQLNLQKDQVVSIEPTLLTKILDTWRTKQLNYTWMFNSMNIFRSFDIITKDALEYAFSKHNFQNNDIFHQLIEIYDSASIFKDVLPFLIQLKEKNISTYILSNGTPKMLKSGILKNKLQTYFSRLLSVNTIGVFKPNRKVYDWAVDEIGNQENIWFVSSNRWDIAGAANAGLQTIWLNRKQDPDESFSGPTIACKSFDDRRVLDLII